MCFMGTVFFLKMRCRGPSHMTFFLFMGWMRSFSSTYFKMMELTSHGDNCLVESTPKELRNSMRGLDPQPTNFLASLSCRVSAAGVGVGFGVVRFIICLMPLFDEEASSTATRSPLLNPSSSFTISQYSLKRHSCVSLSSKSTAFLEKESFSARRTRVQNLRRALCWVARE